MEYLIKVILGIFLFGLLNSWLIIMMGAKAEKRINKIYRKKVKSATQKYINSLEHHKIY